MLENCFVVWEKNTHVPGDTGKRGEVIGDPENQAKECNLHLWATDTILEQKERHKRKDG